MTKSGREQKIRNQEIQKSRYFLILLFRILLFCYSKVLIFNRISFELTNFKKHSTPQMIEKVYKTYLISGEMFTFMQHKDYF
jgi:hypothetical protein